MQMADRLKCADCKIPMSSNQEPKVEGTRVHQAFGHCYRCYQRKLKDGTFIARKRNEFTDTEIQCYSCQEWKPHEKFKKMRNTLSGRSYKCAFCDKLWERYRLTYQRFVTIFEKQGQSCRICRTNLESMNAAHVDHDHSCCSKTRSCGSCVRGLLCPLCTAGLGMFKDSPEILAIAAAYLSNNESTVP